jgi:hypothetical protein
MIVRFQILMKRFGYECGLLLKTYTRQEKLTIIEEGISNFDSLCRVKP